jgi:hypothetical protein
VGGRRHPCNGTSCALDNAPRALRRSDPLRPSGNAGTGARTPGAGHPRACRPSVLRSFGPAATRTAALVAVPPLMCRWGPLATLPSGKPHKYAGVEATTRASYLAARLGPTQARQRGASGLPTPTAAPAPASPSRRRPPPRLRLSSGRREGASVIDGSEAQRR